MGASICFGLKPAKGGGCTDPHPANPRHTILTFFKHLTDDTRSGAKEDYTIINRLNDAKNPARPLHIF